MKPQLCGTKPKMKNIKNFGINQLGVWMDLIIQNDGLYQLIPLTKEMLEGMALVSDTDLYEACDIMRLKLTTYFDEINRHVMNDGSGYFFGCMSNTELTTGEQASIQSFALVPNVSYDPQGQRPKPDGVQYSAHRSVHRI